MPSPNHYEVLGLPVTASPAEIESRYRDLARLYNIDSGAGGAGGAGGTAIGVGIYTLGGVGTVFMITGGDGVRTIGGGDTTGGGVIGWSGGGGGGGSSGGGGGGGSTSNVFNFSETFLTY